MEDAFRYLLAIGFVLGSLLWVVRRYGRPVGGPGKFGSPRETQAYHLARISSLRLGPQHTVHVIGVAGQVWLVGCSPAGASLLSQLPAPKPASDAVGGAA